MRNGLSLTGLRVSGRRVPFFSGIAINHLRALGVLLAAVAPAMSSAPARADTISNIATIQWDAGSTTLVRQSNQVDLTVDRSAPALTLSTFQFSTNPSGQKLAIPQTICRGSNGDIPVMLTGAFADTPLSPATVEKTTLIRAGEPLVVSVTSAIDNRDPLKVDTLTVTLNTPGGDEETLILSETGINTNLFVGLIKTSPVPPTPIKHDCELSLQPGDKLQIDSVRSDGSLIANTPVEVLIDPYGVVFDSRDATPINGTKVTLVDADTGAPATVFGDDGISLFPSTLVTGSTATDARGVIYTFPAGEYRFPFAKPGRYKLLVEPPSPYKAPSLSSPSDLASLRRPDGLPFALGTGSYGAIFVLADPAPVRIDLPADKPLDQLTIQKTASAAVAVPGDAVQYRVTVTNGDATHVTGAVTLTDRLPAAMRLKPNSVRYNGNIITYMASNDGTNLSIGLPPLAVKASAVVTYLLEVRPDAKSGQAVNRAQAHDSFGSVSAIADAAVRIARDGISDRMTIIGRITDGGCTVDPGVAKGIVGVRVMMEDGSYAVTDLDGRYHFEGVIPGTHVVQIDPSTLGATHVPVDCARNARSAGSAISRFVEGQGGALLRADFRATAGTNAIRSTATAVSRPIPAGDAAAAGAERDWFTGQAPGIAWLFPEADHNPRTKAVRVAIKHLPGQTVSLFANGKPVEPMSLDGTRKNADGTVAITLWRALDLADRDTLFTAEVHDTNGTIVERLSRKVHFSASPLHAEFLRDRSLLVADGVTRPVIAVRLTDRDGNPIHHGLVGDFSVPAPYYPAVEADAQQARQLAGLERARPVWHVQGDDGIAYIELEPTTASGALALTLPFRDGEVTRTQRIDAWLTPGNRPWTVVGFAAGTTGINTVKGRLEDLGNGSNEWLTSGRVALYAKGKIQGKWLLTLAYDSAKSANDTQFGGTLDPQAYYTVYADRSERRYDASSIRKLYVRLERPQFYALFGDYDTGMAEPQLTRYVRTFNGLKTQYRSEHVAATAFASNTPYSHRRQEIQGNGLSGPYGLAARDILPNSETITIEVRDRLRSDHIIDSKVLTRHIDYDIDYVGGTLTFRSPVLSRSSLLDPQFIIADYEVDGVAQRVLNAGGRASWSNTAKTLTVGASGIHNEDDQARTNVGGVDVRYSPSASTEIRAEFAGSDSKVRPGSAVGSAGGSLAWLVEVEHHGPKYDIFAYAREQQAGYGVGQQNASEVGTRKFGADGRLRINHQLSFVGSAWQEIQLGSDARRDAGLAKVEYHTKELDLRAGVTIANDHLADGSEANSTIIQLGATKKLLNNRLELDAQTEFAPDGLNQSVDFPARHTATARFAITPAVTLIGSYEIATGAAVDARTARIGFDLKPWSGARFIATANRQDVTEYGPRSYAAYGLAQSLPIGKRWTVDFSLDGNRTLAGIDPSRVLNVNQPVASGGFLGINNTITEDFTAVTGGATYRAECWSWNGRVEYRNGNLSDRYGVTTSILRTLGEGRALGATLSWFRAKQFGGPTTESAALAMSWANRPNDSKFSWLEKLELRSDKVSGAVAGQSDAIGSVLLVTGDAVSKRIINSLSVNWSPTSKSEGRYLGRSEVSLFWGSRYVADRYDSDDLTGWSNVVGADIKFDLSEKVDLGVSGTVRESAAGRAISYSGGPALGLAPFHNGYISVGYNVVGYNDRDYNDARYTRSGPYVTMRFKFDQNTLSSLGLGSRTR
ncbi:DUF11 domain-containing protein [Sphingomonas paeninsulae]|uniref:DUF11 domain-containing protein n=2 Tax=Sphingomonas paeninsulae TaxID=2319844 RepID=A0A494T8S0_SPHPE|nr:DUF11 domain-containing protein [Sphingomonas paeninsulae]